MTAHNYIPICALKQKTELPEVLPLLPYNNMQSRTETSGTPKVSRSSPWWYLTLSIFN